MLAPARSVPARSAFIRFTWLRLMPARSRPERSRPDKFACTRHALGPIRKRLAANQLAGSDAGLPVIPPDATQFMSAPAKWAPATVVSSRFVLIMLAALRLASVRS